MKLEDFNNIDFKNAGNLPWPVKGVMLGVLFVLLVAAGYWFLWSPSLDELDQAKHKETELREVFLGKKSQAINLDAYKQQMIDVEKTFGALLRQLPDKSQMDGLLTDINQAGLSRGLDFELFKPNPEVISEFYAEMPITIRVVGNYNDLGAFATEISKLSRIVTINDISISATNKEAKDNRLSMDATAKTYRYLDASEVAAKKNADKKNVAQ
ncbi:MAG TPA: type 4a pilus biogenesis protein PilO [Methylophilaceae bacterium]|nr:type 4a pilus biogenesis protein PilO [Methylotenera sp.]HSH71808.1 type 4a pilus biogenesis protein PilO [Methylophilaceae bacterium]